MNDPFVYIDAQSNFLCEKYFMKFGTLIVSVIDLLDDFAHLNKCPELFKEGFGQAFCLEKSVVFFNRFPVQLFGIVLLHLEVIHVFGVLISLSLSIEDKVMLSLPLDNVPVQQLSFGDSIFYVVHNSLELIE